VIQVAATVLPGLHLPDWTVTLVIVLVVLGFPIAFAMAWMFDAGRAGIERTPPVRSAHRIRPHRSIAAAPAAAASPIRRPPKRPRRPRSRAASDDDGRRTIAVLPFVNMSGDAENEYFSDGIAEEILNLLTQLPQLKVASRTPRSPTRARKPASRRSRATRASRTLLEGSVRKAGDRVRITAQLIDTGSDSHLWSETYDREMKDVFAIQDDIAHSIVKATAGDADAAGAARDPVRRHLRPEAYDYYLRGRSYMYSMARRDYEHAIRMFEQAIGVDSKYALAYAGMADAYSHLYRYAEATPGKRREGESRERAGGDARTASRRKRMPRAALALIISERYEDAEQEFETAIAKNPNLFDAWHYYGLACSSRGDYERRRRCTPARRK
jgi:adenylate cyclase